MYRYDDPRNLFLGEDFCEQLYSELAPIPEPLQRIRLAHRRAWWVWADESPPSVEDGIENATIANYDINTVRVKTGSSKPRLLFLSEACYPGWNAYLDDHKVDVCRADYGFRAVAIPSGSHIVEFGNVKLSVAEIMCSPFRRCQNSVADDQSPYGKTPAEVAGIKVEGDNKWITITQNASKTVRDPR